MKIKEVNDFLPFFRHRSFVCPEKNSKTEVSDLNVNSKFKIPTKFNNIEVNSLIDTSSQATVLQNNVFEKLKVEKLQTLNSTLGQLGGCQIKSSLL